MLPNNLCFLDKCAMKDTICYTDDLLSHRIIRFLVTKNNFFSADHFKMSHFSLTIWLLEDLENFVMMKSMDFMTWKKYNL